MGLVITCTIELRDVYANLVIWSVTSDVHHCKIGQFKVIGRQPSPIPSAYSTFTSLSSHPFSSVFLSCYILGRLFPLKCWYLSRGTKWYASNFGTLVVSNERGKQQRALLCIKHFSTTSLVLTDVTNSATAQNASVASFLLHFLNTVFNLVSNRLVKLYVAGSLGSKPSPRTFHYALMKRPGRKRHVR